MDHLLSSGSEPQDGVDVADLQLALDGLASSASTAEVADALVAVGLTHAGVTRGVVLLARQDRAALDLVAAAGYDDGLLERWRSVPVAVRSPVTDAYRTCEPVVVASVEELTARYPDVPLADEAPHALVGLPLLDDARAIGAWGLRVERASRSDLAHVVSAGRGLSRLAGSRLEAQRTIDALRAHVAQLEHALQSRIVIEQAKGVLVARHGVDLRSAFELLRRTARDTRRRIHDVAAEVVRGDLAVRPGREA